MGYECVSFTVVVIEVEQAGGVVFWNQTHDALQTQAQEEGLVLGAGEGRAVDPALDHREVLGGENQSRVRHRSTSQEELFTLARAS